MLSILIPVYNYNVVSLAESLHKMALEAEITFEIICIDDASELFLDENQQINQLQNASFNSLPNNIGRSTMRNLLAKKAVYENLLFLDADTFPIHQNFLSNYIAQIDNREKIVYGGILYESVKPSKEKLLRWIYGTEREALSVFERNKNAYLSFLTLNFLITKSVFSKVGFNENIANLRHEDTLFSFELMQNNVEVLHIENPVYHLGLESSETFLRKSEEAVLGLKNLVDAQLISTDYVKLSSYLQLVKKYRLKPLIAFGFKITKPLFVKQLLGAKPSLLLFDLYRLGYYCNLKTN